MLYGPPSTEFVTDTKKLPGHLNNQCGTVHFGVLRRAKTHVDVAVYEKAGSLHSPPTVTSLGTV